LRFSAQKLTRLGLHWLFFSLPLYCGAWSRRLSGLDIVLLYLPASLLHSKTFFLDQLVPLLCWYAFHATGMFNGPRK
jgi:hypothetical protein